MKTIRRLYFYAVAFISLEVVLWGLIGLLRSIFSPRVVTDESQALARALALILVGVPIFMVHWLWAQRAAAREEEEKTASLRAVFLYGALFATLIPVVHNLLALIDRSLLSVSRVDTARAILGGGQTWTDNIIAILLNLLIAAYFWNVLRAEWRTLPDQENFAEVRRLYRYLWVLYSLLMVVFGAQQVLRYVFYIPTHAIGIIGREAFVNGTALLLVGTPIWYTAWRICQRALPEPGEQDSLLRLGVLYFLTLSGVITVLTASGSLLYTLLHRLLGDAASMTGLARKLGGQLSLIIPFGAMWAYYGRWLAHQMKADEQAPRRAGKQRLYSYLLSIIGLTATFIGVSSLISLIIGLALGLEPIGGDVFRRQLAGSVAVLVVALPLWLLSWRPMQAEALQPGDMGDHARRSVLRKTYLYLVLFASVIGGMVTAVALVFNLLQAALSGETESTFLSNVLNALQVLLLFMVLLVYHLAALRRDGASVAGALESKHADFHVLVFDADGKFGEVMKTALVKQTPALSVQIVRATEKVGSDAKVQAVVLPGSLAVRPSETLAAWLRGFTGARLIVPDDAAGVYWTRDTAQAAQFARGLAEGQELRPKSAKGVSAWMVVIYIFAALFAIQFVFILFALGISAVTGF